MTTPNLSRFARVAGFLYLLQMATGVFGFYAHERLMVSGNTTESVKNVLANERLFRIGTISDVITAVAVVVLAWCLYVVLQTVDRNLALLALLLRVVENAIAATGVFNDALAWRVLRNATYSDAFESEQLNALARLLMSGQSSALQIAFVFVGFGSAIFSYLWLQSNFIPRAIAILGIFASLLLAIGTLVVMALPDLGSRLGLSYMMPMGLYEVGLGLWLLIRGVSNAEKHQIEEAS